MPSRVWRPHKSPHNHAYWPLGDFATIRKEMAPQVGLEPTTLRLTGQLRSPRHTKPYN